MIAVVTTHRDRDAYAECFRRCLPGGVPLAEGTIPAGDPWCRGKALNSAIDALLGSAAIDGVDGVVIADIDCLLHPSALPEIGAMLKVTGGIILGVLEPARKECEELIANPARIGAEWFEAPYLWGVPVTPESALLDAERQYTGVLAMRLNVLNTMIATHRSAGLPGLFPEYGTWGGDDTLVAASLTMHEPKTPYARGLVRHMWHEQSTQKPAHGSRGNEEYQAMTKRLTADTKRIKAAYCG